MEDTKNPLPGKIAMNYGILLGIILILISVIMYITGMALEGKQWPMYIYYLIFPVVIIFAIKDYKNKNNDFLTLSDALKTGVATGVISALMFLAYNLIFNYIIEPTYSEQIIDKTRDTMSEMSELTSEQIETSLKFVKWLSNPLLGGAIWLALSAFFSLIYSLIAGLIMKNKNPYEEA